MYLNDCLLSIFLWEMICVCMRYRERERERDGVTKTGKVRGATLRSSARDANVRARGFYGMLQ